MYIKMECNVCFNNFNMTKRKMIECVHCQYKVCMTCVKTYLLMKNEDSRCMNCKGTWDHEFIDSLFPYNFRHTIYKQHRQNVLFQSEEAFFPETLSRIEMNKEQIHKLKNRRIEQKEAIQNLQNSLHLAMNNLRDTDVALNRLNNNAILVLTDIDNAVIPERRVYVKKCFRNDCNGFINHKGHCPICNLQICMKCYEEKGIDHVCKDEDVASVQIIQKETKPCPKCAIPIQKISGCNQMWCTVCNTAFDWVSGKVISGRIHNPHFYEWLTNGETTENVENVQGRCPFEADDYHNGIIVRRKLNAWDIPKKDVRHLLNALRLMNHIQVILLPMYTINEDTYDFYRNSAHRIDYINGDISLNKFKQLIQQKEKQLEKKRAFFQLLDVFVQASLGFFTEIIHGEKDIVNRTIEALERLRQYVNNHFEVIRKRFHCRIFHIDCDFQIIKI